MIQRKYFGNLVVQKQLVLVDINICCLENNTIVTFRRLVRWFQLSLVTVSGFLRFAIRNFILHILQIFVVLTIRPK